MNQQEAINYDRIAEAITYLAQNFREQPSLEEMAKKVHLSPFHFQRLFSEWAGVSPKKFLQFLTIDYAKGLLRQKDTTIFDAAYETGLSGTGRLHDLFINIEGMTPGEFKNGGAGLQINYCYSESPFGLVLMASTRKGICYLAFADNSKTEMKELKALFPNATFHHSEDSFQQKVMSLFTTGWGSAGKINLHLKGTEFQLKVWEALLKIPSGNLSTYSRIAQKINQPNALRAVGTAIGHNPVAFLIPCHRVIQTAGTLGNYHWGKERKSIMIGWEAARCSPAV